jgi:uncharacterized protein
LPDLETKINRWVEGQLDGWIHRTIDDRKVIQDPVHGLHYFQPHEIEIIDSPIVQRLRYISQVGLAKWLYPGACHTRFDHSLGMAAMVEDFTEALKRTKSAGVLVNEDTINNLRMTAILHDIGHSPFSHAGESFLDEWSPEIHIARTTQKTEFGQAKVHEILSHMIVTSKAFSDLLNNMNSKYKIRLESTHIANLIVGVCDDPQNDFWMVDMINGYFDTDKMDYMKRDSHFAGIKLDLDFERIMNSFQIEHTSTGYRRLVPKIATLRNLEQFAFNKLLMFSSVYHHHVVRAADRLFDAALEWIFEEKKKLKGTVLTSVADLLDFTDADFFTTNNQNDEIINQYIDRIKSRNMYRRAGIVSLATVDPSTRKNLAGFLSMAVRPDAVRKLRRVITAKMNMPDSDYHDIWIDMPPNPTLQELDKLELEISPGKTVPYEYLSPGVHNRLQAYAEATWQTHGFAIPSQKEEVFTTLKETLHTEFGVELNDYAKVLSKI